MKVKGFGIAPVPGAAEKPDVNDDRLSRRDGKEDEYVHNPICN